MAETWLTQEAYDRLKAELEYLSGEGRVEIAQRIDAARDEGDLKENAGYHAAREEQGKQEARIAQLTELLRTAKIGETPADDGVVELGMVVTAEVGGKERTFLLGSREAAEGLGIDVFSESSPIGQSVTGHKAGETVEFTAPNGTTITVKILSATPYDPAKNK